MEKVFSSTNPISEFIMVNIRLPTNTTFITMEDFLFLVIIIPKFTNRTVVSCKFNSTTGTVLCCLLDITTLQTFYFLYFISIDLMTLFGVSLIEILDIIMTESACKELLTGRTPLLACSPVMLTTIWHSLWLFFLGKCWFFLFTLWTFIVVILYIFKIIIISVVIGFIRILIIIFLVLFLLLLLILLFIPFLFLLIWLILILLYRPRCYRYWVIVTHDV
jgi:hypothetical protein